jgi:glutamyl-tRNA synthetase
MVREFREKGYLADALLNFIALLGWSLDDKTVLFTMDELIRRFDLAKVNKAPAVFSYEKLDWFNGVYIRGKSAAELYDLLLPYFAKEGLAAEQSYLMEIIPLIRERLKTLSDAGKLAWFFFDSRFEVKDGEHLVPKKLERKTVKAILEGAAGSLKSLPVFDEAGIEKTLRDLVAAHGVKTGDVFMSVRVAVTGTTVSPGLFETIRVLGRERSVSRLEAAAKGLLGPE